MKRLLILIPLIGAFFAFILAHSSVRTRTFDIPAGTMFAVAFESGGEAARTLEMKDLERARFPLVIGFTLAGDRVEQFVSVPSVIATRAYVSSLNVPSVDTGTSIIIFRSCSALRSFSPLQIDLPAFPCTILGAQPLRSYNLPALLDPLLESLPSGISILTHDRPLTTKCETHRQATGRFATSQSAVISYSSGTDLLTWWVKTLNSVKEDEKIALLEDSKEIEKTCLGGMKFDEFLAEIGPSATFAVSSSTDGTWALSIAACTKTPRAAGYLRNIADKFISEANDEGGKFSVVNKKPNEIIYDMGKGIERIIGRKVYMFVTSGSGLFTASIGTMNPVFSTENGSWCDYELKIDAPGASALLSKNSDWIAKYIARTDFKQRAEEGSKKERDTRLGSAAVSKMRDDIRESLKTKISDATELESQTELLLSQQIYNTHQEIIDEWLDRFEASDEFARVLADTKSRFRIFLGILRVPGRITILKQPAHF